MSGPRRSKGTDPSERLGLGRRPAGYTEEAVLSEEEIERRLRLDGGGHLEPPGDEPADPGGSHPDPDAAPPAGRWTRRGRTR
ncbi:MAG TPA: hypothetical protein VNL94_05410, partial [Candidatus Binatia bacterium]|nr:hypothetical protein [Candidatus Binatia bacterium]